LLSAFLLFGAGLWLGRVVTQPKAGTDHATYHPFRSAAARSRYLEHYDARAEAWPVPSETRMVSTTWGETFVRISGPRGAPPLVLLPGASANSLQWMPNVAALSEVRRTYAVDNIYDVGRSVSTRRPTSAADFTAWLEELFDGLELEEDVALMGLSYGGWLTAEYALRRPERLDRIVLLAPAATVHELSRGFIWRAVLAVIPHRLFVRNLIFWFAEDSLRGGEETRRQIEAFVDDAYVALRTFAFRPMVPPRVMSDSELASIEVPALFLVGANEKLYSPIRAIERLARVAPQIETRLVPDAGHDLTLARADLVHRLILEFLEREGEEKSPGGEIGYPDRLGESQAHLSGEALLKGKE
jgi:pimeloyl-ACP methyl ester carboxylesterase